MRRDDRPMHGAGAADDRAASGPSRPRPSAAAAASAAPIVRSTRRVTSSSGGRNHVSSPPSRVAPRFGRVGDDVRHGEDAARPDRPALALLAHRDQVQGGGLHLGREVAATAPAAGAARARVVEHVARDDRPDVRRRAPRRGTPRRARARRRGSPSGPSPRRRRARRRRPCGGGRHGDDGVADRRARRSRRVVPTRMNVVTPSIRSSSTTIEVVGAPIIVVWTETGTPSTVPV